MKNIRATFIHTLLSITLCTAPATYAQSEADIQLLMQEKLSFAEGKTATVTRLEAPPGYKAASHSHPGETFVYVESGRILNQVNDEEPKVYEAGDYFFEPANATHARFENTDPENSAVVIIFGIRPVE